MGFYVCLNSCSAEGACERDGAFRALVAVFDLSADSLPCGVFLPCAQGLPVAVGSGPWPELRLSRTPCGSDVPPDRLRGGRAELGARGEPPGSWPLHSGPSVARTLEPQTQGLPGAGQKGALPAKILQHQAAQWTHKATDWVYPPSPADRPRDRDSHWTLGEKGQRSQLSGHTEPFTFHSHSGVFHPRASIAK